MSLGSATVKFTSAHKSIEIILLDILTEIMARRIYYIYSFELSTKGKEMT